MGGRENIPSRREREGEVRNCCRRLLCDEANNSTQSSLSPWWDGSVVATRSPVMRANSFKLVGNSEGARGAF